MTGTADERRALVVEDDAFTRGLLSGAVRQLGFAVADAADVAGAVAQLGAWDPDLALIDTDLGDGPNGRDLVSIIERRSPWTACLLISGHRTPALVEPGADRLPAGTYRFISKRDIVSAAVLADAIEQTMAGTAPPGRPARSGRDDAVVISRAQADVLRLVADGLSNEAIAQIRGISPRAVEAVLTRLYRRAGIPNDPAINRRVQATLLFRSGRIDVAG